MEEGWLTPAPQCGACCSDNERVSSDGSRSGESRANEDRFHTCYHQSKNRELLMVLDGHEGTKAVDFAQPHIPQILSRQDLSKGDQGVREALRAAIVNTEQEFFLELDRSIARMQTLQDEIERNAPDADSATIYRLFPTQVREIAKLDEKIKGGTTVVTALIYQNKLYVANVGDSRALLCAQNPDGSVLRVEQLSVDHNTSNEEELRRLAKCGLDRAELQRHKRLGTQQNTRSIGDYSIKAGYKSVDILSRATSQPGIAEPHLCGPVDLTNFRGFLILMSDGLYEAYEAWTGCPDRVNEDIARLVGQQLAAEGRGRAPDLNRVVQNVVEEVKRVYREYCKRAGKSGRLDDITLVVKTLQPSSYAYANPEHQYQPQGPPAPVEHGGQYRQPVSRGHVPTDREDYKHQQSYPSGAFGHPSRFRQPNPPPATHGHHNPPPSGAFGHSHTVNFGAPTGNFNPPPSGNFDPRNFNPAPSGNFDPRPSGHFNPPPSGNFNPRNFDPPPSGNFDPPPSGNFHPAHFNPPPSGNFNPPPSGNFGTAHPGNFGGHHPPPPPSGNFNNPPPSGNFGNPNLPPNSGYNYGTQPAASGYTNRGHVQPNTSQGYYQSHDQHPHWDQTDARYSVSSQRSQPAQGQSNAGYPGSSPQQPGRSQSSNVGYPASSQYDQGHPLPSRGHQNMQRMVSQPANTQHGQPQPNVMHSVGSHYNQGHPNTQRMASQPASAHHQPLQGQPNAGYPASSQPAQSRPDFQRETSRPIDSSPSIRVGVDGHPPPPAQQQQYAASPALPPRNSSDPRLSPSPHHMRQGSDHSPSRSPAHQNSDTSRSPAQQIGDTSRSPSGNASRSPAHYNGNTSQQSPQGAETLMPRVTIEHATNEQDPPPPSIPPRPSKQDQGDLSAEENRKIYGWTGEPKDLNLNRKPTDHPDDSTMDSKRTVRHQTLLVDDTLTMSEPKQEPVELYIKFPDKFPANLTWDEIRV